MSKKRLDLQMFADASAQLQNTTGSGGMTAEMKTYYEKTLLDLAEPALVHDQFGDSYPIPANNGKTIEFRKYDALPKATTPLTEGVTPDGQALNVTTITAEVHQYGGWVALTDMLDLTAIDNNVVQATKSLASQGGRTMDTMVRDILNGGTNVIYAPKIAAGAETAVTSRADLDVTAQLTVDLIDQAVACCRPRTPTPSATALWPLCTRTPATTSARTRTGSRRTSTRPRRRSSTARSARSTTCASWCPARRRSGRAPAALRGLAVYSTLVLGAHAYATTELEGGGMQHIVKQLGYGDDPLNQRASVGWKAVKTAERLSEQYMVRIESCSARYSKKALAN